MRYPLNAHKKELAVVEGARECENQLAKEIQDDELGDEEGGLSGVGQVRCWLGHVASALTDLPRLYPRVFFISKLILRSV